MADMRRQNLLEACKGMLKEYGNCGAPIQQMAADAATKAIREAQAPRTEQEEALYALAIEQWEDEGECEIDDDAIVSISEDQDGVAGAYVQAWVFVRAPEREA